MKGIVFTEFLEMVESKFGEEETDKIIEKANLESGGAYTAVGTYPASEMFNLVHELSLSKNIPIPDLLKAFGEYLFTVFGKKYAHMIEGSSNAFDFLETVENHIHVEVKKLYPDAELPSLDVKRENDNTMKMTYQSKRRLADLAEGLITGCLTHFQESASIDVENLTEDRQKVLFTITKK